MFTIIIKDNSPDLEVTVTRALLAIAVIACLVFSDGKYLLFSIAAAVLLFSTAVFIKQIIQRFSGGLIWILLLASILLFLSTRSVTFAVILFISGMVVKFFRQQPEVMISEEGITIKKIFSKPMYPWNQFSNVILKDNLLTLDFINNHLLQLTVEDSKTTVDEQILNEFCQKQLL